MRIPKLDLLHHIHLIDGVHDHVEQETALTTTTSADSHRNATAQVHPVDEAELGIHGDEASHSSGFSVHDGDQLRCSNEAIAVDERDDAFQNTLRHAHPRQVFNFVEQMRWIPVRGEMSLQLKSCCLRRQLVTQKSPISDLEVTTATREGESQKLL
jgi:hypothetical protein